MAKTMQQPPTLRLATWLVQSEVRKKRMSQSSLEEPVAAKPDDDLSTRIGLEQGGWYGPPCPRNVELFQKGFAHLNEGRLGEAEETLTRLLALEPGDMLTEHCLGIISYRKGEHERALERIERTIKAYPKHPDFHSNRGLVLAAMGRLEEAQACYHRALELDPTLAEVRSNLAKALRAQGLLFVQRNEETEAASCFRRALEQDASDVEAHYNLAVILGRNSKDEEAESHYRTAIGLLPSATNALINLGALLKRQGRLPEAVTCFERAIRSAPRSGIALHNLCLLKMEEGEFAEAEELDRRALEAWTLASDPRVADAQFHLSLLLLLAGRYSEGWPLYEARHSPALTVTGRIPRPSFEIPEWRGEPLEGKRILLHREQGFGDQIQFCRFAAVLKERGAARVDVHCARELKRLFESNQHIARILSGGDRISVSDYDFWALQLSVPLHCKTTVETIPATIPYLHADRALIEKWKGRLGLIGVKVGVVWRGRSSNTNDRQRSLSLETLAPLWAARTDAVFVSLQKGAGEAEATSNAATPLVHVGSELEDFADSAAVLANLDLLISVDTAVAHLAGALGRPCWILLHAPRPDWRWMLSRTDSPWYPRGTRLFRQETPGDWASVVEKVAEALRNFVPYQTTNGHL